MGEKVRVLVGIDDAEFVEEVRRVSDRLAVFTSEDLKSDPELLGTLEVAFGGLRRDDLPKATRLRWLQTVGAGVEGVLTPGVKRSDLILTNASGIHGEPIAEQMFGMLLMVTRCLGQAWDQQKTRQWKGFEFGKHVDLIAGKTLGVLGVGAIGGHSAKIGKAFGMRVIGLRRSGEAHPFVDRMYTEADRLEFFRDAEVIMNSLPLTERTRHFVGRAELGAMKQDAILINTGRGGTVDQEALIETLNSGKLKAALLDVTGPEPLPENHPLWTTPRVFITPHYAGGHPGYQRRAGAIFLENLRRYLAGEAMVNAVDKGEGY